MDTDHDGLTDGFEVKSSRTKPLRFDTDGDRIGDGLELLMSRDPLTRERKKPKLIVDPVDPQPAADPVPVPEPPPPSLDVIPPETSISSGPSGTVTSASASFAFTSSEAGSTFECRLDSGAWSACTSPNAYTGLANGSHVFDVRASDAAGNTDLTPASGAWTVNVDTTAPDTRIGSGPSGTVTSNSASFAFTASEAGSTFECRLDAGAWGSCTSPKSYANLAVGSHTFDVRATDAADNTDATPATRAWTVAAVPDTTPPETTISSGPSGTVATGSASFAFTSSETGSTFECRLDAGAWGSCSSPKAYSNLANGSHTFDVRATDAASNVDASPASRSWTVDVTAPPPGSAQVYLSPTGSDAAACTQTAPCRTMSRGYAVAAAGNVIQLGDGVYPAQDVPSGTKAVIFRGGSGVTVRQLYTTAANATFDGVNVDAAGAVTTGAVLELDAANSVFKNASVGNVTDEKGSLAHSNCDGCVYDNVNFHDVRIATDGIHNECLYSQAPNITVKNSTFTNCATMDIFFTRGTWWGQPAYGGFTLLNNYFGKTYKLGGEVHYYTVVWANNNPIDGATVRGNTFELPTSADAPFTNSVESCNSPPMNEPGVVQEPCS